MLTVTKRKNFTSSGDAEAEKLLERVLGEIRETLSGTKLCVVLGGSYGRGTGGVRQDRENGILYNDLDFFVFARKKCPGTVFLLKNVAKKYEHELKVDVDFSAVMTARTMRKNASRLMMQELKRGYYLVCGEDLLAENLTEDPPACLPFSEACRLLLNRGMGLLLAGEKISGNSKDTDFILRNLYKAILGAGDAMMIARGEYLWDICDRRAYMDSSDLPESWKELYREAVEFKRTPHREEKEDMKKFWEDVRDFFRYAALQAAEANSPGEMEKSIYSKCRKKGEDSLLNFIKYCIKSRSVPPAGMWKYYTMPTVAVLAAELCRALENMPEKTDRKSKLYQHWLIFN